MKRRNRRILNRNGLTLVEVMVAITILLMAAEIISLSVTFAARMNTRSQSIFKANEAVGKEVLIRPDDSSDYVGTMNLKIKDQQITNAGDAWMYSEAAGLYAEGFKVNAMWADDRIMMDLFKDSGVEAPEITKEGKNNTLPEVFPDIGERAYLMKTIHVMEHDDYVLDTGEENGTIIFNNEAAAGVQKPSCVDLGNALDISSDNVFTASGITVMEIGDINLNADRISIWMDAEVYHLYGDITGTYSKKYIDGVPIHMYLVPDSGHKQPALIFVGGSQGGISINISYVPETGGEAVEMANINLAPGWYAIPTEIGSTASIDEKQRNAKDLLRLTADEWAGYRLTDGNMELGDGAVDKAFARLILAGLIDSPRKSGKTVGAE